MTDPEKETIPRHGGRKADAGHREIPSLIDRHAASRSAANNSGNGHSRNAPPVCRRSRYVERVDSPRHRSRGPVGLFKCAGFGSSQRLFDSLTQHPQVVSPPLGFVGQLGDERLKVVAHLCHPDGNAFTAGAEELRARPPGAERRFVLVQEQYASWTRTDPVYGHLATTFRAHDFQQAFLKGTGSRLGVNRSSTREEPGKLPASKQALLAGVGDGAPLEHREEHPWSCRPWPASRGVHCAPWNSHRGHRAHREISVKIENTFYFPRLYSLSVISVSSVLMRFPGWQSRDSHFGFGPLGYNVYSIRPLVE